MNNILDAETLQSREGIRARAEDIQRTLFLDRDGQEFKPEKYIRDIIGSQKMDTMAGITNGTACQFTCPNQIIAYVLLIAGIIGIIIAYRSWKNEPR